MDDILPTVFEIHAYCPRTGVKIRPATADERAAYLAQHPRECFRRRILVGAVAVDSWTGPGVSHTPGRFSR